MSLEIDHDFHGIEEYQTFASRIFASSNTETQNDSNFASIEIIGIPKRHHVYQQPYITDYILGNIPQNNSIVQPVTEYLTHHTGVITRLLLKNPSESVLLYSPDYSALPIHVHVTQSGAIAVNGLLNSITPFATIQYNDRGNLSNFCTGEDAVSDLKPHSISSQIDELFASPPLQLYSERAATFASDSDDGYMVAHIGPFDDSSVKPLLSLSKSYELAVLRIFHDQLAFSTDRWYSSDGDYLWVDETENSVHAIVHRNRYKSVKEIFFPKHLPIMTAHFLAYSQLTDCFNNFPWHNFDMQLISDPQDLHYWFLSKLREVSDFLRASNTIYQQ